MAESIDRVVIELEKIRNDLNDYKAINTINLEKFKKETRNKFEGVRKDFQKQDEKIKEAKEELDDLEKIVITIVEQQKYNEKMLNKIDGTSVFIRNSLITGAISLLIAVIIRFA